MKKNHQVFKRCPLRTGIDKSTARYSGHIVAHGHNCEEEVIEGKLVIQGFGQYLDA